MAATAHINPPVGSNLGIDPKPWSPPGVKYHYRFGISGSSRPADIFTVLAGETAPTLSDGYAQYNIVERPTRTSLTIFSGLNPLQLTLPVVFEQYINGDGHENERAIALLERMAGRGVDPLPNGVPPRVNVTCTDSDGTPFSLLPRFWQFEGGGTGNLREWLVTGIEWDDTALRNENGHRIRQAATITLTQHVAAANVKPSSASKRKKSRDNDQPKIHWKAYYTNSRVNSLRAMLAAHNMAGNNDYLQAAKKKNKIRDGYKTLRPHTKLWIPDPSHK